jgi:hypothetical protein
VYSPVALAGLGDLPATLMSRSVVIRMRRRAPGEHVEPFRIRAATAGAAPLAGQLAAWMAREAPALAETYPDMPEGITDRPADVWEPLLAVADAARGDWPKRAREACAELAGAAETGEASLGVRLLADLWEVFGEHEDQNGQRARTGTAEKLATKVILDRLRALDESPWAGFGKPPKELDARGLANRLRAYGVRSDNLPRGEDGARPKGYFAASLADPWERYVPASRTAAPSAPPNPSAPHDATVTSADVDGADGADLRELGPCARCGQPCTRYGDNGRPLCDRCQGGAQ